MADTKRILQTKQAIRRVFELQKAHRGYCVLEILAPCPTNFRMDPLKAAQFCLNEMEREFPLGTFRDAEKGLGAPVAAAAPAPSSPLLQVKPVPQVATCAELFAEKTAVPPAENDPAVPERRFKFAGYGGQGATVRSSAAAARAVRSSSPGRPSARRPSSIPTCSSA